MTETRIERTPYAGLLALMEASQSTQGWANPYWNAVELDAMLNALANGARTGTVPIATPSAPPNVGASATAGTIPGGITLEVAQTWVDAFGRETEASTLASIETTGDVANPDTAPAATDAGSSDTGFDGGSLEVWYSYTDATGGETLPSPSVTIELPYLTGGLKSQVSVVLPFPAVAYGAAGANIYARSRSGNTVLVARILVSDEDTALLDGSVEDCIRSLPLANSTGSLNAIDISGAPLPVSGEAPTFARFYIRQSGGSWYDGADHRLKIDDVSDFDPATVYATPITYSGSSAETTAGFPPAVSQVKALAPIDLTRDVTGILPIGNLPEDLGGGGSGVTLKGRRREIRMLCNQARFNVGVTEQFSALGAFPVGFSDCVAIGDGVVSGFGADSDYSSLNVTIAAGTATIGGSSSDYVGGTIAIPGSKTARKIWWTGAALAQGDAWPGTAHAKIAMADSTTNVDTVYSATGVTVNSPAWWPLPSLAVDLENSKLVFPAGEERAYCSATIATPNGVAGLLADWLSYGPTTNFELKTQVYVNGFDMHYDLVQGVVLETEGLTPAEITSIAFVVNVLNYSGSDLFFDYFGASWEDAS